MDELTPQQSTGARREYENRVSAITPIGPIDILGSSPLLVGQSEKIF
ncbi:hypothetical protein ACIHFD_34850 [Nonomuraea sp. NPDC051941]